MMPNDATHEELALIDPFAVGKLFPRQREQGSTAHRQPTISLSPGPNHPNIRDIPVLNLRSDFGDTIGLTFQVQCITQFLE